jgi:hypothetical protein
MNSQIQVEDDMPRRENLHQSKRFTPSKIMERLVPVLLLILAAALVGTILLVIISSIK